MKCLSCLEDLGLKDSLSVVEQLSSSFSFVHFPILHLDNHTISIRFVRC